ncbi:1454_t:CDS:10 [Funneliformis geosporum]|uniref:5422_t:CDS:1 n=1 Tax=Funneliformis geosporum TaxID=1117311 RepID=A0A9W4SRF3_9GLOM|nr:1454_t:CDS:10 [Funneliformis geosporum]CAI2177771.1 5422_t:CDS:10 [Funneliformis geosporum]
MLFATILVFISFIAYKIYQKTKVPEGLEDVPTISYFGIFKSMFYNEGPDKRWEDSRQVLEKYGIGKFWFHGEWYVVTTDLELIKDVFAKTDLYPKLSLEEAFPGSLMTSYFGTNVVFSNGDVWKRHRFITNPAFKSIPMQLFDDITVKLLKVIEKVDNEPIEVKDLMDRLILDVLGRIAFKFDFNYLEDPTNVLVTTYKEAIAEVNNPLYFLFPFIENIPYFYRTEARKKVAKIHDLFSGLIEERRKSMETDELSKKIDNNSADLLECMINASKNPKYHMSDEEMRYNLSTFMIAGHETTATALTTVLYVLATHKDVQSKVREELLRVLGDNLIPTIEQQKELKYMNMVLHENLRLYPPIHQLPRRENAEIIKFRNHTFLLNTPILVNIYGVHHSPKYWKDPEEFIPERFENENDEKRDQNTWLPFGGGSRICLGNTVTLIEERVMLCTILRKYEVSLPADSIHKDKLQLDKFNDSFTGLKALHLIFKRTTN